MARRRKWLCADGCGQLIDGRKNKRFVNDTHSKRYRRNGGHNGRESAYNGAEAGSEAKPAAECCPDGTVRDYIEVCCSSCHRVRPECEGPLRQILLPRV